MFGIGMPEFILIMAIALIVIGPKKLPDLAKALGRALGEFKKATSDLKDSLEIDTPLSDVKRSFDDLNKNLKNDFTKNTLGDSTSKKKSAPTVQVPPEPYLDKAGAENDADAERKKTEVDGAAPKELDKPEFSGLESDAGELTEKENPEGELPERELTATEPESKENAELNEKKDSAPKA